MILITSKKFIEEYKTIQNIYQDFAESICLILRILLKDNAFNYQEIFSRVKDPNSLYQKINKHKKFQNIKTVKEIDDLAGCRIIFYLDKDIDRFREYIFREFNIVKDNLRYSEEDYNARHIIVKLSESRLALSEYAKFSGTKCEIQLTTVLYHAWSEMNHDIIYKPQGLSDFDEKSFELLKEQFGDVMKNHIKEAQKTFDFISDQVKRIKQGEQIFNIGSLKNIINSESNNEIYENLFFT